MTDYSNRPNLCEPYCIQNNFSTWSFLYRVKKTPDHINYHKMKTKVTIQLKFIRMT